MNLAELLLRRRPFQISLSGVEYVDYLHPLSASNTSKSVIDWRCRVFPASKPYGFGSGYAHPESSIRKATDGRMIALGAPMFDWFEDAW